MFYEVECVLAVPAILTEIDSERAVADHRVEWSSEAVGVETIGPNDLP
jgi:hypothetical protein